MFNKPEPEPPTPEEMKAQITLGMLTMVGVLEPIYDTADGMRRDLEARGWSPTMAEQAAGNWLCAMLTTVGRGGQ
ncbi:hypothetical protein [Streptomyces chryseus]|uniref:hypothetical protein n=1 Tax=Streptomyces chryseus TaxID=68186 RepID=UPI00110F95FC|nr:hypothetical protein [Streptomyces chryseus]GGX26785.1 hypothetical protein GCM10010353_47390 [Streptomyces chryseus]